MNLSSEEKLILNKLLSKARESTAQMIETCENLLHKKTAQLPVDRITADQKRFEMDLINIKSLEEKLLRESV